MRNHLFFSGLLATCGLFACGSLDGHTDKPTTLATVHGELSNPGGVATKDVRVAIVWLNGTKYSVAEDLPVQPVFPSQFALSLTAPPPADALFPAKGDDKASTDGIEVAFGFVVAYEDQNGNGKLDLVESSDSAFIDKIVGANSSMAVIYLAAGDMSALGQDAADSYGNLPTRGYGLLSITSCTDAPCATGIRSQYFSINEPYNLVVTSDPEVNQLMCLHYGESSASTGGGSAWDIALQGNPAGGFPAPGTEGLTCVGDTYSIEHCTTTHTGLCEKRTDCKIDSVTLGGAAKPAGWPCP